MPDAIIDHAYNQSIPIIKIYYYGLRISFLITYYGPSLLKQHQRRYTWQIGFLYWLKRVWSLRPLAVARALIWVYAATDTEDDLDSRQWSSRSRENDTKLPWDALLEEESTSEWPQHSLMCSSILLCTHKRSPVPANLSSGEDKSVAQVVISVEFSVVERLLKTGNQELG